MASYHLCGLEASDNTLRWRGVAPITVALAGAHRAALTRRLAVLGAGVRRLAAVETPAVVADAHALRRRERRTDHLAGLGAAL